VRPFFARVLKNRVSATGVALTTASALLFVALVVLEVAGVLENPYAGLVVFVMVPALFVAGLLLIPFGLWLERRAAGDRQGPVVDLGHRATRRMGVFLAAATVVNLVILSLASYGAVEYSESQSFCGQVCHTVMEPEFVAHQNGPHAKVHCVTCHVGPGARGMIHAKVNGIRQVYLVATGGYRQPIPTPVEDLPSTAHTCQQCHWPDRHIGDVVKVIAEHADDEANTPTTTTVKLHVGGATGGTGYGTGIHWHTNPANAIEYVAGDEKLEQIPYVRQTAPDGTVHEYFAEGADPAALAAKPRHRMECIDCHSRPAHSFGETPERAVDAAIANGQIDRSIPFVRREAVRALTATYPAREAAPAEIDKSIRAALQTSSSAGVDQAAVGRAISATQAIYNRNIFPTMKVTWGSYPNQVGHTTANGCFRCHDDQHKTRDGRAIRQDCELCHTIE
jgi:nitrate/TMAO reductase-like tetraheme cytochrome c subunit